MTRRRGHPRPLGISKNFGQKNFGLNFVPYTSGRNEGVVFTGDSFRKGVAVPTCVSGEGFRVGFQEVAGWFASRK